MLINRRRTMLKILGFDTGGYWRWSKRLEQGRFALGRGAKEAKRELNRTALLALVEGVDIQILRPRPGARRRARCAQGGCGRCTAMPTRWCCTTHRHVHAFLGKYCATLLSDGDDGYCACAAQRPGEVTHALCWSHTRRTVERAKDSEPEAVAEALALIAAMYAHEKQIRADALTGEDKRAYRQTHTRPVVETFWRWCREQCHRPERLAKSPLAKALNDAQERRTGLEVFLDDPAVAIDTNHLERALRPIPLGKRNWLFASSEVGAQRVGIIQSLLVTCRLHGVDAYTDLVDMLQRISMHPANRAIELTPRMWKSLFADAPLRSDLGPHYHDPPPH